MTVKRFLCHADDLPEGSAKGFASRPGADDEAFFALRHRGRIHAYLNRCPHTGVTLNWMPDAFLDMDGYFVICSTHGALFQPHDGLCVRGPCVGASLATVSVIETDSRIWLVGEMDG